MMALGFSDESANRRFTPEELRIHLNTLAARAVFGFFDPERNRPLTADQERSIIQRCNDSKRHGKTRRAGHRPHGTRLEHYKAMRRAEQR